MFWLTRGRSRRLAWPLAARVGDATRPSTPITLPAPSATRRTRSDTSDESGESSGSRSSWSWPPASPPCSPS